MFYNLLSSDAEHLSRGIGKGWWSGESDNPPFLEDFLKINVLYSVLGKRSTQLEPFVKSVV